MYQGTYVLCSNRFSLSYICFKVHMCCVCIDTCVQKLSPALSLSLREPWDGVDWALRRAPAGECCHHLR